MKQLIKSFLFILAFAIAGDDWTDNKKAIDKSKIIELDRFIFSIGIRHIGQENAKILAGFFQSINKFKDLFFASTISISTILPIID